MSNFDKWTQLNNELRTLIKFRHDFEREFITMSWFHEVDEKLMTLENSMIVEINTLEVCS